MIHDINCITQAEQAAVARVEQRVDRQHGRSETVLKRLETGSNAMLAFGLRPDTNEGSRAPSSWE